uniref:Chemosensory protein 4 n=1 Tax=Matsumurasca onukii TaxID=2912585 RepID=A0A343WGZ9_MATON|nr:chemosensory protein 4 [Matsumurasca onukii]WCU30827.1 chemosensory protein [Matsumurasca onukii]
MKVAVCFVVVSMAVGVLSADSSTYSTAWDNIDLEKVLANDRLISAYVNCLLDRGSCSPEGTALKKVLPEALKTSCAKCTQKQKEKGRQVVKFMMDNKQDLWKEIAAKYDPDGTYTSKFKKGKQ